MERRTVDDVLEPRDDPAYASIPANLGSAADADADGISGDASRTDLLTVEWHADGTFVVSRRPPPAHRPGGESTSNEGVPMNKPVLITIGVVLVVLGGVWALRASVSSAAAR